MSAIPTLCTVDVFYGPEATGNQHHIAYSSDSAWGEGDLPFEYNKIPNLILLSSSRGTFQAQFFNSGRPVRRCGSGNLAIATYIHGELKAEANGERLVTPAGTVQLGFDRQSAYYLDKPLIQQPLHYAKLWQRLVRQRVINGCYCGRRNDYVLLELRQPLARFRLNSTALCRFSQRALIVIYRPPSGAVQLRYFAPQYGAAEDAATGSASMQAAGYLGRQYPQYYAHQQIEIKQCSPAGGYLYLKSYQQRVLVRGRTEIVDSKANCSSFDYTEQ